jgi:hypothetical protein
VLLTTLRSRGWYAAVLALALVSGATAWAFTDRSSTSAPAADRTETSPAALSKRLPFNSLLHTRTQTQRNIALAQRKLTVSCMAERGFQYKPAPIANAAETADEHPTPFGLESLAAPAAGATQAPPSETPVSKAFTRALYGDPDDRISAKGKLIQVSRPADGCQAEAEKRLLGDRRLRWLQLRIQLGEGEKEAQRQLEKDPAFRTANARWRTCMRAAGFDEKDPVSLLYELPRGTDLRKHPAVRADIRCKGETNYLSSAYTRLHAVQRAWLDRHGEVVTAWQTLQGRQGDVAREVLGVR